MFDSDKSNFVNYLKEFPYQIKECRDLFLNFSPQLDVSNINNIVFSGMGGSAISSDLFVAYTRDEMKVPCQVNREYSIPAFVDRNTLFIASSYSGDTEETLRAAQSALEKGTLFIGISSGGELERICHSGNLLHIKIPPGLPPRQALGYLFFPLLFVFKRLGFITIDEAEIEETEKYLRDFVQRYSPETSVGKNLANHVAQTVYHTIPIIYTAVPYLMPVPIRWRNQFNENAKVMAFSNVFPELNHNEIMGWEGPQEINKNFRVIILRDIDENERNKQRVRITKSILKKQGTLVLELFAEGKYRLTRLFSLISLGDWASYYLAMLNEKDPIKIGSIDLLKEELNKVPL
jgi:glucose/mannose-6-phosphate isomerase